LRVPGEFVLPQSLASVADVVWNFMRREERADGLHSSRSPVLLFSGPRGIGKTQALYLLRDRLTGTYPCAYLDGEWLMESTWDMLLLLSFELNQLNNRSEYGTLSFPRLTTGAIVITANLTLDLNRAIAREQISDLLAAHRKTKEVLESTIAALAKGSAQALALYDETAVDIGSALAEFVARYGSEALLGGMAKGRHGRAALFGTGQEWWRHQGPGLGGDPFDKLVTLRQDADRARGRPRMAPDQEDRASATDKEVPDAAYQPGNREARARVTGLLWAAFLADLRENFADRRRAVNWTRNCVVLLDNADTKVSRLFLTELIKERNKRGQDEPDPLTVAVTSRGGLIQPVRLGGLTPLAQASVERYQRRTVPEAGQWWYPIALPAIDWQETGDQIALLELASIDTGALTTAVYALAGGHLAATRTLVAALGEQSPTAVNPNLAALLTAPEPETLEAGRRTVQQAMLDTLLTSLGKDHAAAEDLGTCAAARHREAALRLSTEPTLMEQLPSEDGEGAAIFTAEFWRPDPTGVPAFLYPVARRLLLLRLAAREPHEATSWARVHAWLRHRARLDGKESAELYHTLALAGTPAAEVAALVRETACEEPANPAGSPGTVDPMVHTTPLEHVTRQIAARLVTTDAREWLNLVSHVTAAPNRLDRARTPRDQVRELTSWASQSEWPIGPVARYVAHSWLGADPLSAAHWRQLLREMAKELDLFAEHSNDAGLAVLRDEADRYREIAADWRDVAEFWMTRVRLADEANRRADR
jgi:DNA polymerase III delta prime subunit